MNSTYIKNKKQYLKLKKQLGGNDICNVVGHYLYNHVRFRAAFGEYTDRDILSIASELARRGYYKPKKYIEAEHADEATVRYERLSTELLSNAHLDGDDIVITLKLQSIIDSLRMSEENLNGQVRRDLIDGYRYSSNLARTADTDLLNNVQLPGTDLEYGGLSEDKKNNLLHMVNSDFQKYVIIQDYYILLNNFYVEKLVPVINAAYWNLLCPDDKVDCICQICTPNELQMKEKTNTIVDSIEIDRIVMYTHTPYIFLFGSIDDEPIGTNVIVNIVRRIETSNNNDGTVTIRVTASHYEIPNENDIPEYYRNKEEYKICPQ